MSDEQLDRDRRLRRFDVRLSRFASVFFSIVWPLALSGLLLFAAIGNRSWPIAALAVALLVIMLPWMAEALRTRVADHAFVVDDELYLDAGREQLIVSASDVRQIGVLGANSLHPTWNSSTPHLAVDLIEPATGKRRRYVVALVDELLLRQLRSAGFAVSPERIK